MRFEEKFTFYYYVENNFTNRRNTNVFLERNKGN